MEGTSILGSWNSHWWTDLQCWRLWEALWLWPVNLFEGNIDCTSCDWKIFTIQTVRFAGSMMVYVYPRRLGSPVAQNTVTAVTARTDPNILGRAWEGWVPRLNAPYPGVHRFRLIGPKPGFLRKSLAILWGFNSENQLPISRVPSYGYCWAEGWSIQRVKSPRGKLPLSILLMVVSFNMCQCQKLNLTMI